MGVNSSISLNSETVYNSNVSAQPGGGSGRSRETPFHPTGSRFPHPSVGIPDCPPDFIEDAKRQGKTLYTVVLCQQDRGLAPMSTSGLA